MNYQYDLKIAGIEMKFVFTIEGECDRCDCFTLVNHYTSKLKNNFYLCEACLNKILELTQDNNQNKKED